MDIVRGMAAVTAGLQADLADIPDRVAGVAIEILMGSGQRIFGLLGVIEAPATPAVRVVTKGTFFSEPPLMKLVFVATGASRLRVFERSGVVTLFAWHDGVTADQREGSEIVIERHGLSPAGIRVTLLAAASEPPHVHVIALMTGGAIRRQLVVKQVAGVTAVAFDARMRSVQRKLRALMIELHALPPALVVTRAALAAVPPLMNVLQTVTIGAAGRRVGVALPGMAGPALDRAMGAPQRKFRGVVI